MPTATPNKHSVMFAGRKTSISLEPEFWRELLAIAAERGIPIRDLVAEVDAHPARRKNLSSELRLHVLRHFTAQRDNCAKVVETMTNIKNAPKPRDIRRMLDEA